MTSQIEFSVICKRGLILKVPENIDIEVVNDWVDEQKIIMQKESDGNFIVACIDDSAGEGQQVYSFMRFFTIGEKTVCSVDFQSDNTIQMIEKLTRLLVKQHES